ncbi:hypothetical protein [Coxiella-like endosymbiont]|uniref:hypothetical protein n=1 Tax=Coxiella-like endosymbiont TaxID=1592897 RepID=UPI00272A663D|nr:hypothetical protein [Coxiella-like endosymbiont]
MISKTFVVNLYHAHHTVLATGSALVLSICISVILIAPVTDGVTIWNNNGLASRMSRTV